jgi:hypothetical protein
VTARYWLSDADRDRLAEILREHYALGRLTMEELERRLGLVLAAQYSDEAADALSGLAALPGPTPARRGRGGRHAERAEAEAGWLPTGERFRDPSSGQIMRVWIDPADQSRHYIPDG